MLKNGVQKAETSLPRVFSGKASLPTYIQSACSEGPRTHSSCLMVVLGSGLEFRIQSVGTRVLGLEFGELKFGMRAGTGE